MSQCGSLTRARRDQMLDFSGIQNPNGTGLRSLSHSPAELILSFNNKERATNCSSQFGLLFRKLEFRFELRWHFHSFGKLEANSSLLGVINRIHNVDDKTALVEDIGEFDVLHLK